jgi:hypothetical protein
LTILKFQPILSQIARSTEHFRAGCETDEPLHLNENSLVAIPSRQAMVLFIGFLSQASYTNRMFGLTRTQSPIAADIL